MSYEILNTEREQIAKRAVSNKKTNQLLVNMDEEAKVLQEQRKKNGMSMMIAILPLHPDAYKDANRGMTIVKDPVYGVIYGISIGEYPDGNIRWRRIILQEHRNLNLENLEDCKVYLIFRMHSWFDKCPKDLRFDRDPEFKIFDTDENANAEEQRFEEVDKAMERARELKGEKLVKFARLLNITVDVTTNLKVVRSSVKKLAMEDPYGFNQRWDSDTRTTDEVFASATSISIIKYSTEKGFMYEGYRLGMNEFEAKRFLTANPDTLASIVSATNESDNVMKKIKEEETVPKEKAKKQEPKKEIEKEKETVPNDNEDNFN
jgi:hypothetical protein